MLMLFSEVEGSASFKKLEEVHRHRQVGNLKTELTEEPPCYFGEYLVLPWEYVKENCSVFKDV